MLSDYRLISYRAPYRVNNETKKPGHVSNIRTGYTFKNTVKLISVNSAVVDKYLGIHNLSDYKLRKVKQSLEIIIPIDLEALCYREVPEDCILL